MSVRSSWSVALAMLGIAMTMSGLARAEDLRGEIAPSGKLRVAIAISSAGGAFWSNNAETGYTGVPVDLGKEMATQLGVHVEYASGHGFTPVAVCFNCWINRRTRARLYNDGRVERIE